MSYDGERRTEYAARSYTNSNSLAKEELPILLALGRQEYRQHE
jgi:hypothetical protein